jgi:hypothetical protein
MSCSGSHLGITINIKNTKFVKDLPMIDAQFRFNQCNSFREECLTLDPMGKMFQNASLKPLRQLKPNCPGMIIGRFSTKFLFFMPIGNPRWLPPQVIVLTQGKIQKYILL